MQVTNVRILLKLKPLNLTTIIRIAMTLAVLYAIAVVAV
jgi:hypothetical protein